MFKKEIKRPSTSKTPIVQLTADIPINHSYWCFITDSVGWPLIQIITNSRGAWTSSITRPRIYGTFLDIDVYLLGDAFHNARS